jgi:hypothetical protein
MFYGIGRKLVDGTEVGRTSTNVRRVLASFSRRQMPRFGSRRYLLFAFRRLRPRLAPIIRLLEVRSAQIRRETRVAAQRIEERLYFEELYDVRSFVGGAF